MTAWRICKAKHAASALGGYGAKLNGGRWNSRGRAMVYTAATASQAFLEMLVHADATIASLSYVLIPVTFDDRIVRDVGTLRVDWRAHPLSTRAIGDAWLDSGASAILRVPSAILDVEPNFLINPAHPDAKRLAIGKPQPLIVDLRIKALFGVA